MATSRGFLNVSDNSTEQTELGDFSLAGAFDFFDPLSGILPVCEFNYTINDTLTRLNHIVQDARKMLSDRDSKQIIQQAETIQHHINQNSSHFLRYLRFSQLLDEASPSKALLFCIDDLCGQSDTDKHESWSKANCFSILALSLVANMYTNFWKSVNELGINSKNEWNIRHYEWFINYETLAQEAINHASKELIADHDSNHNSSNNDGRIVEPNYIVAQYIDYMLAEFEKNRSQEGRFVFKTVTAQFIDDELNEEQIYMMGSDKCLNSLLKHWREYRKIHSNWQDY